MKFEGYFCYNMIIYQPNRTRRRETHEKNAHYPYYVLVVFVVLDGDFTRLGRDK